MGKRSLHQSFLLFLLLIAFPFALCFSQDVVCRASRIAGFDNEYSVGSEICGESVSEPSQMKIYFTEKYDQLYVHSNYMSLGADYPTKIATSSKAYSLTDIISNIISSGDVNISGLYDINSLIRNEIEFVVSPSLIKKGWYEALDFSHAGNVKVVCPDNQKREITKIIDNSGTAEFGIKYNDQFSIRMKEANLEFIFSELRTQRVDFSNIRIISLVENSSTKNVLDAKFTGKTIAFDYSSKEALKKKLLENKGTRTIILGHIENGNLVTYNSGGQELFRISVSEIEAFQQEQQLELIILGCNASLQGATTGPMTKFNSVDALNRLATAKDAKNVEEFLDSLSFRTLHFLIDETFFTRRDQVHVTTGFSSDFRTDIIVYEGSPGGIRMNNRNNIRGAIIMLGLGTAELINSQINPPPPPGSPDTSVTNNNKADPGNEKEKRRTFLFVLCGVAFFALLAYFLHPSDKKKK